VVDAGGNTVGFDAFDSEDTTGAVVLQFTHRGLGSQAVAVTGSDMNVVELDIV